MAQEQGLDDRIALTAEKIRAGKTSLGIEFGSTRIKAVLLDEGYLPIASGSFTWENQLTRGVWTYALSDAETGLQTCFAALKTACGAIRRKKSGPGCRPHTRRSPKMSKTLTAKSSPAWDASASPP